MKNVKKIDINGTSAGISSKDVAVQDDPWFDFSVADSEGRVAFGIKNGKTYPEAGSGEIKQTGSFDASTEPAGYAPSGIVLAAELPYPAEITKIELWSNAAGSLTFAVGFTDQRGWAITGASETFSVKTGVNSLAPSSRLTTTEQYKQLFAYPTDAASIGLSSTTSGTYRHAANTNATLNATVGTLAVRITTEALDKRYAQADDLDRLKATVAALPSGGSENGSKLPPYVLNANGKKVIPYVAEDGTIKTRSLKITNFGNSLWAGGISHTDQKDADGNVWTQQTDAELAKLKFPETADMPGMCDNRGMAASTLDTDYKHILYRALSRTWESPIVQGTKVSQTFERYDKKMTEIPSDMAALLDQQTDAIVFRIGENAHASTQQYALYLENLEFVCKEIRKRYPNALLLVGSEFWSSADAEKPIAERVGATWFEFPRGMKNEKTGPRQDKTDDLHENLVKLGTETKTMPNGSNPVITSHPCSFDFCNIADSLLRALGEPETEWTHSIMLDNQTSRNASVVPSECWKALVTVKLADSDAEANVTIEDADGNTVPVQTYKASDLSWRLSYYDTYASVTPSWKRAYVFEMPDSDAKITIK